MKGYYFPCALIGAAICVWSYNVGYDFTTYAGAFMCAINSYCHFEYSK